MANQDSFETFPIEKKRTELETFNASERLDKWLNSLNKFHNQIDNWLNPFYEKGLIISAKKKINISEEFIGSYDAVKLVLYIGKNIISFKPIGTLILGSFGRVDLAGPFKDVSIVEKGLGQVAACIELPQKEIHPTHKKYFRNRY